MLRSFVCLCILKKREPLFPLPCVMDARALVGLVRSRCPKLEAYLAEQLLAKNQGLKSRAFLSSVKDEAGAKCAMLSNLKERDVEDAIFGKYGLKSEQAVTCMVPYQLAANIILSRLPPEIRSESVKELRQEEESLKGGAGKGTKRSGNKWIGWYERDLYVSDGLRYLARIDMRKKSRIPVFAVMGHINHGKTTLLDALQGSRVAASEAHGITQTVRAFTAAHPDNYNDLFTFMDVPGHKMFVETRYHSQRAADCILLVLSVPDGIESQTHEAIKVALNLDKPVIVILNKIDQLSDPFTAQQSVRRILRELDELGLDVCMIEKAEDLGSSAANSPAHGRDARQGAGGAAESASSAQLDLVKSPTAREACFLPMKRLDPAYKGSGRRPVLNLRRKCYGVCISAYQRVNLPLLWRLLQAWKETARPQCHSNSIGSTEHNGAVQALVVESSKHLFDEEGFRQSIRRQNIQRRLDRASDRRASRDGALSTSSKMNKVMTAGYRQYQKQNRTSTRSLVISVIVKEGVVARGMEFVADQAEGRVDYLLDYWGYPIEQALPGMAATIVDARSESGCPGPGIHVLSVTSTKDRLAIYQYRRMLQWYVELFTTKLHYLKPRGMDVSFTHLGDYGQLQATYTLEYQLLYGAPPPSATAIEGGEGEQGALPQPDAEEKSLGQYLAELNAADETKVRTQGVSYLPGSTSNLAIGPSSSMTARGAVAVLPKVSGHSQQQSEGKRIGQGLIPPEEHDALENAWQGYQLTEAINSMEDYERHMRQCVQIGVLLKVDNYHTARMLTREIPRLGTKKVAFQVVGVRFGPLTTEDIMFFAGTVKAIVCFRTPYAPSTELDHYIEINDQWVLHTDHFADIATFLKWCAVAAHKEYYASGGKMSDKRLHVPLDDDTEATDGSMSSGLRGAEDEGSMDNSQGNSEGKGSLATPQPRKRKLLLYSSNSDTD